MFDHEQASAQHRHIIQLTDERQHIRTRGDDKEALARWLHENCARRGGPFVTVSPGSIAREHAARALFGSDENGGVRDPSAPKKYRPSPVSAKWTATETISSTSTDASASGW